MPIRLLIFITGFCSMIYELGLAQLLSSLFGNTILRYATTLAIYIISMGLGSFIFKSKGEEKDIRLLYRTEMIMAILGMLAPFVFILLNYIFIKSISFSGAQMPVLVLTHLFIGICGFICGYELPILSSLSKIKSEQMNESRVLAWDYSGMFIASLIFPLFLFPVFGIFQSFWICTILNIACLFLLHSLDQKISLQRYQKLSFALLGLSLILVFTANPIGVYLSEIYAQSL